MQADASSCLQTYSKGACVVCAALDVGAMIDPDCSGPVASQRRVRCLGVHLHCTNARMLNALPSTNRPLAIEKKINNVTSVVVVNSHVSASTTFTSHAEARFRLPELVTNADASHELLAARRGTSSVRIRGKLQPGAGHVRSIRNLDVAALNIHICPLRQVVVGNQTELVVLRLGAAAGLPSYVACV